VLSDATLIALVAQAPNTLEALAEVKGIGPSKLARYGSELLGLLHRKAS
jgi:DNA helicase-2/ATP-dependent DNA helicase PcrA